MLWWYHSLSSGLQRFWSGLGYSDFYPFGYIFTRKNVKASSNYLKVRLLDIFSCIPENNTVFSRFLSVLQFGQLLLLCLEIHWIFFWSVLTDLSPYCVCLFQILYFSSLKVLFYFFLFCSFSPYCVYVLFLSLSMFIILTVKSHYACDFRFCCYWVVFFQCIVIFFFFTNLLILMEY